MGMEYDVGNFGKEKVKCKEMGMAWYVGNFLVCNVKAMWNFTA
jgi:hypothetical protein